MVETLMKACCGFGHRTILKNIENSLYAAVLSAAQEGCKTFYTGGMGDFDAQFSSAVRKLRIRFPDIKLICVKPYFTNEINTNGEYYAAMYDDIVIPPAIIGVHYKRAITARNRWMVDNSDLIVSYIIRDYGGAADTIKYAKRMDKKIISLAE